ncbi:MAG: thiol-disulfide isomerase/thioredoxin [Crocinitomicaceae bacterium]|jgi:thiol-disulfide isomerase/thioredoxin
MKYFFGLSLFLLLAACGDDETTDISDSTDVDSQTVGPDNFTINGAITGADGQVFYLEAVSQQGQIPIANATADAAGKFTMTGNIVGFGIYQLRLGEPGSNKVIPLTIVPNDKVVIKSDIADYEKFPKVSGTSWSSAMTSYMEKFSIFHAAQSELMLKKGVISDEELTERFVALKKPVDDFGLELMIADPGNPFNIILSSSATPTMGFDGWDPKNLEVLKAVSKAYEEKFPNSPMTATLVGQTTEIERAYDDHVALSTGKRVAPEIALKNPEGREIKLSSLRGKYVLIDFWASWCGPCRKESPNVVKMYNKYKSKGFTVYSVSLDENKEAWKAAIASDGMVWPNHVSDLLRWNSPLPQTYGFSGIPHTVLLNPEGNIIGVGLRGPSLEQKLKEIFI